MTEPTTADPGLGRSVGTVMLGLASMLLASGPTRADGPQPSAPSPATIETALDGHGGPVKGVAVSADGRLALTASFDYSLILWDLSTLEARAHLFGHDAAVNTATFLPGDQQALSASDDGTVGLWDLATGHLVRRMAGHRGKVVAVAASGDGRLAASAGWDRTVRLWDLGTGALVQTLGSDANLTSVRISGDDRIVVAGATDGDLHLWRLADGTQLGELPGHDFGLTMLDLDRTGQIAVTASIDETVRLWDLAAGATTRTLFGHDGPVLAVALSPDGQLVASGGVDGTVRLWRRGDGDRLRVYERHTGAVWTVAFTPDGHTLLSGGADGLVLTYDLDRPPADDDVEAAPNGRTAVATADRLDDGSPVDDGSRGARLFRKCQACHTVTPSGGHRAGPSLHGVFGRVAGSREDYPYSTALKTSRLVWDAATIDRLFEIGPETLIPGSKMPLQRMPSAADRAELVAFLARITAPGGPQ